MSRHNPERTKWKKYLWNTGWQSGKKQALEGMPCLNIVRNFTKYFIDQVNALPEAESFQLKQISRRPASKTKSLDGKKCC